MRDLHRASRWPGVGVWNSRFPPDRDAATHPAIWCACEVPSIVILDHQRGCGDAARLLASFDILSDVDGHNGRHLILQSHEGRHRLLARLAAPGKKSAFSVISDPWLDIRLAAMQALHGASIGIVRSAKRPALNPTAYQRYRFALLLDIIDYMEQERLTNMQAISMNVVHRGSIPMRAIEWKNSSQRRQTQRLVKEAGFFVHKGYRLLLKGKLSQRK